MIRRATVIGLVLVTAIVLETALMPWLAVAGYRPDLLLLVVTVVASRDGPLAGARVAAAAGVLVDLLQTDGPLGLSVIALVPVGYAVGVLRPYAKVDSPAVLVGLAAGAGLVGTAVYGLATALLADQAIAVVLLARAAVAVAILNAIVAVPLDLGLSRLLARLPLNAPAYPS